MQNTDSPRDAQRVTPKSTCAVCNRPFTKPSGMPELCACANCGMHTWYVFRVGPSFFCSTCGLTARAT